MCFAAVYLDHHWIFDVLLGLTYTVTVFAGVRFVWNKLAERAPAQSAALPVSNGA